eukprot:188739-Chlamydomonas_euryale.AAC.2
MPQRPASDNAASGTGSGAHGHINPATFVIPEAAYPMRPASDAFTPDGRSCSGPAATGQPFSLSDGHMHANVGDSITAATLLAVWRQEQARRQVAEGDGETDMQLQ